MSEKNGQEESAAEKAKRGRKAGAILFPRSSLVEALEIPQIIWDNNAGAPLALLDIAKILERSPTGSGFIELIRSAQRYGLTNESFTQDLTKTISLTPSGNSIVAPTPEEDVNSLKRKALESPEIFRDVFSVLHGKVIPPAESFKNMLIRTFHLGKEDADACYYVLTQNIEELGLSETIQGKTYLRLDKLGTTVQPSGETDEVEKEIIITKPETKGITGEKIAPPCPPPIANQIFVIHGKNRVPLDQLKKILDDPFKIPYKVALDEPNVGRPISQKVAELMKTCTSAIVIFTADDEYSDSKGNKFYRPSDNAVYELGAASILYGKKIVILKEESVTLSSDFSDLGHITFEKDKLDAKGTDLMKEFIGFGLLRVIPA